MPCVVVVVWMRMPSVRLHKARNIKTGRVNSSTPLREWLRLFLGKWSLFECVTVSVSRRTVAIETDPVGKTILSSL